MIDKRIVNRGSNTALLFAVLLLIGGCVSIPTKPEDDGIVMQQTKETVRKTAIDALIVNGFELNKSTGDYIEGYRPRRWGCVAGSGGETVAIWLTSIEPAGTRVQVTTGRTFFGGAGQKDWSQDVIAEMKKNSEKNK